MEEIRGKYNTAISFTKVMEIDFARVDAAAHYIPSRRKVWDFKQEPFDLTELLCCDELKDSRYIENRPGSPGGGNHFIEIDQAAAGTLYLIIHTGSRIMGGQVAQFYQEPAIDLAKGKDAAIDFDESARLVELLKFAERNRKLIAKILPDKAGLTGVEAFHTTQNHVEVGDMIIRKGAISAHAGEKVLIPINVRDGSVLAVGKGNADWNYSAPHGARCLMSRSDAKQLLDMNEYKESMAGVYTTSINEGTLDETVDNIEVMKPVYNFKAAD